MSAMSSLPRTNDANRRCGTASSAVTPNRGDRTKRHADAASPPPKLFTETEVCRLLRLDVGRTRQAQRKAMDRVWRAAQDARTDRNQPLLRRIRLGSERCYEPATVDALLEALSLEF
jgi:hypothetical protein